MNQVTFEQSKAIELAILTDVAKFCDENGLIYYLAYGTLIGAVRHKGFIPWDDDIDIIMPRSDYDRFCTLYNSSKSKEPFYTAISPFDKRSRHSQIKVIDERTVKKEPGFSYKNGQELGVDIDVFPLDFQPPVFQDYVRKDQKMKRLSMMVYYKNRTWKSSSRRMALKKAVLLFVPKSMLLSRWYSLCVSTKNSHKVSVCCSAYGVTSDYNDESLFAERCLIDFEGSKFYAPIGYDQFLKNRYGDYMKLPPVDEQVTHHSNIVVFREGSHE